jgi:hypothetical protein
MAGGQENDTHKKHGKSTAQHYGGSSHDIGCPIMDRSWMGSSSFHPRAPPRQGAGPRGGRHIDHHFQVLPCLAGCLGPFFNARLAYCIC